MDITKSDIRIFLCMPNRDILGEMTTFLKPQQKLKHGRVNELTFTIPYYSERGNYISETNQTNVEKVVNKYFDLIRERYLLKVIWLGKTEWYIVDKIVKSGDISGNEKQIKAFSLPYELKGELLFEWVGVFVGGSYSKQSLTIDLITNDVIYNTMWTINYIDPELLSLKRDFDFQDVTALEALYEIASAYNAVIIWDSQNRHINLYSQKTYGQDKRILFSYDKYLKSIQDEIEPNSIITRLIPIGKDGLKINSMNPTGASYLQDFSYWMQPFKREAVTWSELQGQTFADFENQTFNDISYRVVQSSYWLSDSVCNALLDYGELVNSKQSEYDALLTDYNNLQSQLTAKNQEIEDITNQITETKASLDMNQTQGEDASANLQQLATLETQLNTLISEKAIIESDISTLQISIDSIHSQLAFENNFTREQIEELSPFVNTAKWENSNISTVEDLVKESKEYFSEINQVQPIINIGLIDFLGMTDVDEKIKSVNLADKINIYYDYFDINVQSQIIEMDLDYTSGAVGLNIANTMNVSTNNNQKVVDMIYKNNTVSGAFIRNKHKIDKVDSVENTISQFLNNKFEAAKQEITAGVNETVTINERGITITDSADPNRFIRMMNSIIGLVKDGTNLGVAITPEGIFADYLLGKILAGEKLIIESDSGKFTFDQNGATIDGASFNLTGGPNGVSIDALDGLTILNSSKTVRGLFNATEGIKIQKSADGGNTWTDSFYADLQGNLYLNGIYTGTISFDQANGGTLTLGGEQNGNGRMQVLDENGEIIADLDAGNGGFEWLRIGDVISDSVVKTNLSNLTFYINPINGDDENNGLSINSKKKTIQNCIDSIPKFNAGTINIICDNATIKENIIITGFIGDGYIVVDLQNSQLDGNLKIMSNMNRVDFKNGVINSANETYATVYVSKTTQSAMINLKLYCRNATTYGFSAVDNTFMQIIGCEVYDTNNCIRAGHGSNVYVQNCKGLGDYGIVADYVGAIGGTDSAPVGTISNTRALYGGEIRNTFTHDSGERAMPTPPAPPPAPDVTKTWSATSSDNYAMNGWGWVNEGYPKQGNYGYGRRKGLWFFGTSVYDTVNGKNIKRVRVYIKRKSSGGNSSKTTIQIRSHNYSSKPGGEPSLSSAYKNVSLSWGEGAWVDLPSDFITAFKSGGARGIGVYVTSDSSSYYALMESAAKIEVTYS